MTCPVKGSLGIAATALLVAMMPLTALAQSDRRPGGVENVQSPPDGASQGMRGIKKAAPSPTPGMSNPAAGGAAPPPPAPAPAKPAAVPKDGKSSEAAPTGGARSVTRGPSSGSNDRRPGGVEAVQSKEKN